MKLVCVNNELAETVLTVGKTYIPLKHNMDLYYIVCDTGKEMWFMDSRFKKVNDEGKKKMTIVLNEAAKADTEKNAYDFTQLPLLLYVAKHEKIKGAEKASIIFNLGLVYADLLAEEDEGWRLKAFRTGKNIDSAMTWDSTPQGSEFWSKIHSKLEY